MESWIELAYASDVVYYYRSGTRIILKTITNQKLILNEILSLVYTKSSFLCDSNTTNFFINNLLFFDFYSFTKILRQNIKYKQVHLLYSDPFNDFQKSIFVTSFSIFQEKETATIVEPPCISPHGVVG